MPARSNQPFAASFFASSSFGMIRYAGTPAGPRALISRASASSAGTRRLLSFEIRTPATFRPAKFTSVTPSAFHVETKSFWASATIATESARAESRVMARLLFLLERESFDQLVCGILQALLALRVGRRFVERALGHAAPDDFAVAGLAGRHRVEHERPFRRDVHRRRLRRGRQQTPVRYPPRGQPHVRADL